MNEEIETLQPLSSRAKSIAPFLAMEVFERARELERSGRSIIYLDVGEPDWDTPAVVVEAGLEALRDGRTHYTHSLGHPELREAIAGWYRQQYNVSVSPNRVIVTMGSSPAMLLVFAALLDRGSEVLMTDPHYACYPKFVSVLEGVPVPIAVREEDGFQFDAEMVRRRITPRTRAVILNSPSNPTGTLASAERMRELVSAAEGKAIVVSDEIYHGLVYEGTAHSILEFAPEAIVISGFSKLFAMTGWRLGYAILPEYLVRPIQKLQQNLFISPPDFAQFAAVAALRQTSEEIERRRRCYDERRRLVLSRLKRMGLSVSVEPTGAFYVFVNMKTYTKDSLDFVFRLLENTGLAVAPGIDFGANGEGYIRISYARSLEMIEEGMNRLERFLVKHQDTKNAR